MKNRNKSPPKYSHQTISHLITPYQPRAKIKIQEIVLYLSSIEAIHFVSKRCKRFLLKDNFEIRQIVI